MARTGLQEPTLFNVFITFGAHFGKRILENRPLETIPFGIAFDHFEGHFGEPIVEDRPLATSSFGMAVDYFGNKSSRTGH